VGIVAFNVAERSQLCCQEQQLAESLIISDSEQS